MRQEIITVLCDSCSETAVEYDSNETCASLLDGKIVPCKSCSVLGMISFDYEDQVTSVRFYPLSPESLSKVDFGTMVEAYEAGQKRIDELYEEVSKLRQQVRNLKLGLLTISG
jgi:hypothetical protein